MDIMIAPLFAAPPEGSGAAGVMATFLPIVAMIAILWFLLFRPQQKEQQRHRAMIQALRKGDEVVTIGGMYGKIMALDGEKVSLRVAEGVKIDIERNKVARVMNRSEEGEGAS